MIERVVDRAKSEIAIRSETPFSTFHLRAAGRLARLQIPELRKDKTFRRTIKEGCYADVARALRQLPTSQREQFLELSLEKARFPHHGELARLFADLTDPHFPWFAPTQQPKPERLQQLASQHLRALNLEPLAINLLREDWIAATTVRWFAAREAQEAAGVVAARYAAGNAPGYAAWVAVDTAEAVARFTAKSAAAIDAAGAARWIVVQDLMAQQGYPNGNPFLPLMEIYRQGCWPIGQVRQDEREFIIFVPPLKQAT